MQDIMTIKGIGEEKKGSLYRDLEGYEGGIFYLEDQKSRFLMRQVLPIPKDIELIRRIRRSAARNTPLWIKDENGKIKQVPLSSLLGKEFDNSDKDLEELIKAVNPDNNDDGCISLLVFYMGTGELIASIDIRPLIQENYDIAGLQFVFPLDSKCKKKYEKKLKRRIKEILKESGMYPKDCKEIIWKNNQYSYIPIQ